MSEFPRTVMTVLGPVPPLAMGYTDAHSHLHIGRVAGGPDDAPVLTNTEAVAAELSDFLALGGGGIIDCQPGGVGRDGLVLRALSQRTGIRIVAATGFHRRRYYPTDAPLFRLSADQAAAVFLDEIHHGLEETRDSRGRVYPGFIKIAAEATFDETPRTLLEAVSVVSRATGYAIEMHTEKGAAVEDLLAYFIGQGVAPTRLVFCHVDKRPDVGLHRDLAEAGVVLEYDTFFRPKYDPDRNVWPLLDKMVSAGLGGSVALATDMAEPALWARQGGAPGLTAFFTVIKTRLEAMGVEQTTIDALLGGTIAGRLAIAPATATAGTGALETRISE